MLIEKLVEKKIITEEQADSLKKELAEEYKESTEEDFLLIKRILSEEDLNKLKSEIYSTSIFEEDVSFIIPVETLALVPEESARFYQTIPLGLGEDNVLKVGMLDPENIKAKEAIDFLARQQGYAIQFYLISQKQFDKYIKQYRSTEEEVDKALTELETELGS
ncbi:MAG: hypothetical protein WC303_02055, partial [Candidatus Paceibacterota bacterium]